jgi:hypothetical protein
VEQRRECLILLPNGGKDGCRYHGGITGGLHSLVKFVLEQLLTILNDPIYVSDVYASPFPTPPSPPRDTFNLFSSDGSHLDGSTLIFYTNGIHAPGLFTILNHFDTRPDALIYEMDGSKGHSEGNFTGSWVSAAVPEPSGLLLSIAGGIVAVVVRLRRWLGP